MTCLLPVLSSRNTARVVSPSERLQILFTRSSITVSAGGVQTDFLGGEFTATLPPGEHVVFIKSIL